MKDANTGFSAFKAILFGLLLCAGAAHAGDADWLLGRWALTYDPQGAETDYLEFLPDGDAYSEWADGTRVPGIYVVTGQGVKAVFTVEERDLIATFHADAERKRLKIVTDASGEESVYERVGPATADR